MDQVFYNDEEEQEPTEWHTVWEDTTGRAIRYFSTQSEYERHLMRKRRASFGDRFDEGEENLMSLILHPDTSEFPIFDNYRENFIRNYFHLKQRIEHERRGTVYVQAGFDAWDREVATLDLKADLQKMVLAGRPHMPGQSYGYGSQALHPELLRLIIELCEEHEGVVLANLMMSRWHGTLMHDTLYVGHQGEDLNSPFKAWIRASGPQEVAYVRNHVKLRADNNLTRFICDLTFLLVKVWMKLHEGHDDVCIRLGQCHYREEMGAKIRALYAYGCLSSSAQTNGQPNKSLEAVIEQHIIDGSAVFF